MSWREAAVALALAGHLCQVSAGCHIHAPEDYPSFSSRPLVIPAGHTPSDCQSLNMARFGGGGRCHCFSDTSLESQNLNPQEADGDRQIEEGLYLP